MGNKRVAIVTGSNRGIGFGIVRGLAQSDPNLEVILTARNDANGNKAVDETKLPNVKYHQLDVLDEKSIENLKAFIAANFGGIDILVNNAGVPSYGDESLAIRAEKTVATNYFALKKVCDVLFPILKPGARVVNLAGGSGLLSTVPGRDLRAKLAGNDLTAEQLDDIVRSYLSSTKQGNFHQLGWSDHPQTAAKVGVCALTRIHQKRFDRERSEDDIVVNATNPGSVKTGMNKWGHATIDDGAKSSVFAALLPPKTNVRGMYVWQNCQPEEWAKAN